MNEQIIEMTVRDVDTVTGEIKLLYNQVQQLTLAYIIEIGRRLHEAKSLLPHGAWGTWLSDNFEFSHSQANNFMKLFDEYGADQITLFGAVPNSQTFGNLPYTKALQMLALPRDEREAFAEENNVEEMSNRELKKAIQERNEALEKSAELEEKIKAQAKTIEKAETCIKDSEKLRNDVSDLTEQLEKAKERELKAKKQLKALKDNPEVPKEVLDKMRSDIQNKISAESNEKIEKAVSKANEQISRLTEEKERAEAEIKEITAKLAEAKRAVQMNNPDIASFKALFEQAQDVATKLLNVLEKIRSADPDTASNFTIALEKLSERYILK